MSGEISLSVRALDECVEQAYRKLFPGDPLKTEKLLNWRARENPHGETRFVVATCGREIVGMIALTPTLLRHGSKCVRAYQAVDTVVDPQFRGRGLFVRIASWAQEKAALDAEILWGFPNANAAPGWFRRLGWTNFGAVPLLVRPLRSSFLFERLHPKLGALDFPLVRKAGTVDKVYADPAELRCDFDCLWTRVAPGLGTVVDRTGKWMCWRLLDKPGVDYRAVGSISKAGELQAFLASKIADKHASSIAYVMDAIAAPGQSRKLVGLLNSELSRAAGEGAKVALAWCPKSAPQYPAYRQAGFLSVPPRLRPIEINFGARPLVPDAALMSAPGTPWSVSYLDSDTN